MTPRRGRIARCLTACLAGLLTLLPCAIVSAGGGPQNALLVVNQRSWASKTIANHYVALRQLPMANVVYIDWPGSVIEHVPVDDFREKILAPALSVIQRRGLADQIDYIVYCADFPYAVNVDSDVSQGQQGQAGSAVAAINGLTYFSRDVMRKDPRYLSLDGNRYMRRSGSEVGSQTHGFHSWYGWGEDGQLLDAGGEHYMLSTMLAATTGRGNSVSEVLAYLNDSVASDGTKPSGVIYYAENRDQRSLARSPAYPAAVETLQSLGIEAEIFTGAIPRGRDDIQGLTTGVANVPLEIANSTFAPGAIVDNLTSFGGALQDRTRQTPVTDYLRLGAAGASGTVVEPFLIPAKFPFAFLHVHYARGCSLAEAFYQSVLGPYQLLIVGDPLCQPWANQAEVAVEGVEEGQTLSGIVELTAMANWSSEADTGQFELFVDGQRRTSAEPGGSLRLDTRTLVDGYHELRVVATEESPIESQSYTVLSVQTANFDRETRLEVEPASGSVRASQQITMVAQSPGAEQIAFFHGSRLLGAAKGESGRFQVEAGELGHGPVLLRAVGLAQNDPRKVSVADPITLNVEPDPPLRRLSQPIWKDLERGFLVRNKAGDVKVVTESFKPEWLQLAGIGRGEPYLVTAFVFAPKTDMYQFQLRPDGRAILRVDGKQVADVTNSDAQDVHYVPVHLQDGLHQFEIHGQARDQARLDVRFGGPGAQKIDADICRYAE